METLERKMSEDEYFFMKESINSKAIPAPNLLIKCRKEINDDGNYPTRLVVPATNFTLAFSKLGNIGIKKIMGDELQQENNCSSLSFKLQIESLGIRKDKHIVMIFS
jgi:hypothetical protein